MHRLLGSLCLLVVLVLMGCTSPQTATVETQPTPTEEAQPAEPSATATLVAPTATPESTATAEPTVTVALATPSLAPTDTPPPAPAAAGLDGTLVLYSTVVAVPAAGAATPAEPSYAFRTLPALPFVDPAVFDAFYGSDTLKDTLNLFFFNLRPQLSPNGRYLLVPGLTTRPEWGIEEGTGTWLLDLEAGTARRLLPDGKVATWSPASDAIAYVEGDTLYTLGIAEGAAPTPLFQHENLWWEYAHWSPDGHWIAAVSGELTPDENGALTLTYWLVPPSGEPARELTVQQDMSMDFFADELSWSPDGQYLLMRNKLFDMSGNRLSPTPANRLVWLPDGSHLLANGNDGLQIVTITGEEVARIGDTFAEQWALSRDGRRLAYTQGYSNEQSVFVYDLERGESRDIHSGPASLLRWSTYGRYVLLSIVQDNTPQIVAVSAEPDGAEQVVVENGELIEVVPYPVP